MGFEQFDWKERVGQLSGKTKEDVQCWNCQAMNDPDSVFCTNCSAPVKKEDFK